MSAFNPDEAAAGRDASYPAFRLPFQDIATGNHIAQWVTSIMRQTCSTDADCGGEFCIDGRCFEEVPLM
jgi:TolB protein